MFRDPGGSLGNLDGRLIRTINRSFAADFRAFMTSSTAQSFLEQGRLVHTRLLNETVDDAEVEMIVEHQRLSFASFPYEWPPEMLLAAGHLTLDLGEAFLSEKMGLKDATPYNVLFSGPKAVFVDVLSFERRDIRDPVWLPYAQFVRTFALPLLLNKYLGLPLKALFSAYRDGIEPEIAYKLIGLTQRFRPAFLNMVTVPTWLGAWRNKDPTGMYRRRLTNNPEKARFILQSLLRHLRTVLGSAAQNGSQPSAWCDYMSCQTYSQNAFEAKDEFVKQALHEFSPKTVLDIGCNTGHFSGLAARCGAEVIAIDSDPAVVGEVWRMASAKGLNILPLVVDITRPSPAMGWRNLECPSFLDRARGKFDVVLMLAVIHHMLVNERIPLLEIMDLASELTGDLLLIEFVAPEDPLFRRIARGRDSLFSSLTADAFESSCRKHFTIIRSRQLSKTRQIYYMRKKS